MTISLSYGSTGRPPDKYLRHSSKEFFSIILEFSHTPFHIFSIETTNNNNNNNNYIICYDNGDDTLEDKDINEGDPHGTSGYCIGNNLDPEITDNWSLNQVKLFHLRYKYNTITNQTELILNNNNNNNINLDISSINYNTSTYNDNNKANMAPRIHCTDKIKWFDIPNSSNNNNIDITSNNNSNNYITLQQQRVLHTDFFLDQLNQMYTAKIWQPKTANPSETAIRQNQEKKHNYHLSKHRPTAF
jgi:hypothetical protein